MAVVVLVVVLAALGAWFGAGPLGHTGLPPRATDEGRHVEQVWRIFAVVQGLCVARLGRDERRPPAGQLDLQPGLGQLDLLDAFVRDRGRAPACPDAKTPRRGAAFRGVVGALSRGWCALIRFSRGVERVVSQPAVGPYARGRHPWQRRAPATSRFVAVRNG